MPINVFGNNNSHDNDSKNDTSLFVQKPYLRTKYIQANLGEDLDLKNQFRIKNLPNPFSIREAASKNYFDKNHHQIGNVYLEFNITVRKNDTTKFHH